MTEVITEVTQPTPYDIAAEFVKNNAVSEITERIAKQTEEIKQLRIERDERLSKYLNLHNRISEFIIECVKDDAVDIDDLKELADELNIELTKEIEVTFKVDVKFTATVPLDFDVDKIDDSDFDVSINYRGGEDDVDMEEEYSDIEDFEVSDDN
jgi:hypothetical protein